MIPRLNHRIAALRRSGLSKQEAMARVAAEYPIPDAPSYPLPTPEDLAVCRGGCPMYEKDGLQERCWLGLERGTCYRLAMTQWIDRGLGRKALCERQEAAKQTATHK